MGQQLPPAPRIVLVVEDDPILMLALVEFVEDAGCEAVEANSVDEAVRILEGRLDIRTVFADLDMRGLDAGMQLAHLIRERWPPLELLLLSSRPCDATQLPARGVVVEKPFDRRRIVQAIRQFMADGDRPGSSSR